MPRVTRALGDYIVKQKMLNPVYQAFAETGDHDTKMEHLLANRAPARTYIPPKPELKLAPVPDSSRPREAMQLDSVKPIMAYVKPRLDVTVKTPFSHADLVRVYAHGGTHVVVDRRAWLEANSLDNLLLPTAANYLCPKCGCTISCTCENFDKHGRRIQK